MPFAQGSAIFEELTSVKVSDHSLTPADGQAVVTQEAAWQKVGEDETDVATVQKIPLRF